jgi:hypothetical protein
MSTERYQKVAMKMFPVGREPPGLTWLRREIPRLIQQEVEAALLDQVSKHFPELNEERAKLIAKQRELDEAKAAATKGHEENKAQWQKVKDEVAAESRKLRDQIETHRKLVEALKKYMEWHDGAGTAGDQPKLWAALEAAYAEHKKREGR